jgi:tetratricopeptide (TPR) repeat protein
MSRIELYRTLSAAALAGAALLFVGCADAQKSQDAMKEEQTTRWNLTRVSVMYQLAQQQYAVGDYDKCRKTIDETLALNAPFAPLQTLAGKVELEKGSLEVAAARLKEAVRIDPSNPEPFYLLGVVYQRWQNAETAAGYYQQAWDRKPGEALYMLAVVEMKISMGQLDEAQKILESKKVYFEQSAAVRIALARIAGLKNDHVTASNYYRDAVILTPDDAQLRRTYAEELFYAGKYNEAAAIFEDMRKQTDLVDRDNLLLMLGDAYMNLHRPFDARNCYQELTRSSPDNELAYLALSRACVETSDLGIATAAAQKVLRMDRDNVQAMILEAVVQQKAKRWDAAQETLERAEKVAPMDTTVLCMLGVCVQHEGKIDEAIAYYQKAEASDPKNTWANELLMKVKPSSATTPTPVVEETAATAVVAHPIIQADSATLVEPAHGTEAP